eukprot:CAMPEP_0172171282 /NCGR_PEP_ID=MMETSP1050-20130122/11805_1 /TAXON_ID=233186 /ORGANISM="Cryptomonas curvata, Strain CCAP979/52" /LENGTH=55 /DNA_ID=CAMNT_0012842695 /DNA_START=332 /DNA_END=495 /DNA_ORIENTATION=-
MKLSTETATDDMTDFCNIGLDDNQTLDIEEMNTSNPILEDSTRSEILNQEIACSG